MTVCGHGPKCFVSWWLYNLWQGCLLQLKKKEVFWRKYTHESAISKKRSFGCVLVPQRKMPQVLDQFTSHCMLYQPNCCQSPLSFYVSRNNLTEQRIWTREFSIEPFLIFWVGGEGSPSWSIHLFALMIYDVFSVPFLWSVFSGALSNESVMNIPGWTASSRVWSTHSNSCVSCRCLRGCPWEWIARVPVQHKSVEIFKHQIITTFAM